MPGFSGTGPMGMGPMTGGGRGFCNPYGRLGGRGQGFRTAAHAFPPYRRYRNRTDMPAINEQQDVEYLKSEASLLRERLKDIESEIETLSAK